MQTVNYCSSGGSSYLLGPCIGPRARPCPSTPSMSRRNQLSNTESLFTRRLGVGGEDGDPRPTWQYIRCSSVIQITWQIFHLHSLGRSLYVSNVADTASIIGNIQLIKLSSFTIPIPI